MLMVVHTCYVHRVILTSCYDGILEALQAGCLGNNTECLLDVLPLCPLFVGLISRTFGPSMFCIGDNNVDRCID